MSTFAKNAYELYSDTENVTLIRMQPLTRLSEMNYLTSETVLRWGTKIGGREYKSCYVGLGNGTPDAYYAGMDSYATETYWNPIYQKYLELK